MIFSSFFKALGQLGDRRFRRVFWLGIVLSFLLLVAITSAVVLAVQWLIGDSTDVFLIGEVQWLDDLFTVTSFAAMFVLSVVLMVPVASAITSMFLDTVAQAVEDKHYPGLPQVPKIPVFDAVRDTVNFLGVILAANIVALVFYGLFPPAAPFIFWALNGYLLGMEYFQMVAMRRLGRARAKDLRKRHRRTIWMAGTLMAIPLSIPMVNLLVPILGAATFTHIFHRLPRNG